MISSVFYWRFVELKGHYSRRIAWPTRRSSSSSKDFSLTTAEILYRLPDHPALIQTYIWQDYDLSPRFPQLKKFLEFWQRNLHGALYQVRVGHAGLISPAEIKLVSGDYKLQ